MAEVRITDEMVVAFAKGAEMTDLEELKKLADAATPGPWMVEEKKYRGDLAVAWKPEFKVCRSFGNSLAAEQDAAFIAAARSALPALIERVEKAEAENARLTKALAAEEARNEVLCKRLDAERSGDDIAHCYDPEDWEYTYAWDERDEVHGHGETLEIGEPKLVFTLLRGPRKWVGNVPVTFDEDGEPDETEFRWFDSEEEARAALGRQS